MQGFFNKALLYKHLFKRVVEISSAGGGFNPPAEDMSRDHLWTFFLKNWVSVLRKKVHR